MGEEETRKNRTGKVTSNERSNYKKASDKAKTLIQEYEDSKYVDDALLMLGKCYYYTEENAKAQRQLDILIKRFPESPLIPEAKLWYAKSLLAQEKYQDAALEFSKLVQSDISGFIKGETSFYLGNLYSKQGSYEEAIAAYEVAMKDASKELRAEAMYSIGSNYDSLNIFNRAAESFKKVFDLNPTPELLYDSEFRYGQMLKMSGEQEDAIKLFGRLLGDEKNKRQEPSIRLEIAECLLRKGDIDDAITSYGDIIEDHKRTVFASKASYMIGKIYEENKQDFDRALDNYKKTKTVGTRSVYSDTAEMNSRDIQRLLALQEVVGWGLKGESGSLDVDREETEIDSLTFIDDYITVMVNISKDSLERKFKFMEEIGGTAFADSILQEPKRLAELFEESEQSIQIDDGIRVLVTWYSWYRTNEIPDDKILEIEIMRLLVQKLYLEELNRTSNPELGTLQIDEVDKNLFNLAELYLFRLDQPDSALNQYRIITNSYPESPYAPQALYNQAYILETIFQDTTEAQIIRSDIRSQFPESKFASVLSDGDNPLMNGILDSTSLWIQYAEKLLFDEESPEKALELYEKIYNTSNQVNIRAKVLYAMGWIYENRLDSLNLAHTLYDSLANRYPETMFASTVQPKLKAYTIAAKKEKATSVSDSIRTVAGEQDSLETEEPDLEETRLASGDNQNRMLLSPDRLQYYSRVLNMRKKKASEAMP